MALSKSAVSDLLDALRAGGDLDLIREGLALVLQALIDAEATQHIGARPMSGASSGPLIATGPDRGCCRPRPVMWSCASPSCGRDRSSRRCWSPAAASTGLCWRW
jgi:hypothetical protein